MMNYFVIAASHFDEVVTADGKSTTEEAKKASIEKLVYPALGDLINKKEPGSHGNPIKSRSLEI